MIEDRAHLRRGSFASAMRELAMAQGCDPRRPEVHRLLGLCYARRARWEEACDALREALRLNQRGFIPRGLPRGSSFLWTLWPEGRWRSCSARTATPQLPLRSWNVG